MLAELLVRVIRHIIIYIKIKEWLFSKFSWSLFLEDVDKSLISIQLSILLIKKNKKIDKEGGNFTIIFKPTKLCMKVLREEEKNLLSLFRLAVNQSVDPSDSGSGSKWTRSRTLRDP